MAVQTTLESVSFANVASCIITIVDSLRVELVCVLFFFVLWAPGYLASRRSVKNVKGETGSKGQTATPPWKRTGERKIEGLGHAASGARRTSGEACTGIAQQVTAAEPAQLCDAAWIAPKIIQLARSQVQVALRTYKSARQAGLDLKALTSDASDELFTALLTSSIRVGQVDNALWLLRELQENGHGIGCTLLASIVKLCTGKHLFMEGLSIYDYVSSEGSCTIDDKSIWSCLLFCAVEAKSFERCLPFFDQLQALGVPSQKDYWNVVRFGSANADWQLLVRTLDEMTAKCVEIDSATYNTVLACCVSTNQIDTARNLLDNMAAEGRTTDVITYNTLIKGYAKVGAIDNCFELFDIMKQRGYTPSHITYGILLDACINEKQVDRAVEVFDTITREKCPMNTVLYTTLIKGFARSGKLDEAMTVYAQMTSDESVAPDLITFSIIIKANCDACRLDVALELLVSAQKSGLKPDEVLFNNLLAGCANNGNPELAKRLYADMTAAGVQPSNATFSILIRVFHQCNMLDEAIEMLRTEPSRHKVKVEARIYSQLMQCCIRARQGRRALVVYELSAESSTLCAAANGVLLSHCTKSNMLDTAVEILGVAAEKGGRVNTADATALLEVATRKRKTQCVQLCIDAMNKLRLPVPTHLR